MFGDRKSRRARKVKPGDGHPLPRYRWWQPFSRALFHLRLVDPRGLPEVWSVDVRLAGDSNGEVWAELYRDGVHHSRSKLPAALPIPGGHIEVVATVYGLKRCHFVGDDGVVRQLTPDPASAEGRRARLESAHPALGRAIGVASVIVLLVAAVLGLPQIVEDLSRFPPIAENVGIFTSPFRLPIWANVALAVGAGFASTERALRLRYNWLLDGGLFDGDD